MICGETRCQCKRLHIQQVDDSKAATARALAARTNTKVLAPQKWPMLLCAN